METNYDSSYYAVIDGKMSLSYIDLTNITTSCVGSTSTVLFKTLLSSLPFLSYLVYFHQH